MIRNAHTMQESCRCPKKVSVQVIDAYHFRIDVGYQFGVWVIRELSLDERSRLHYAVFCVYNLSLVGCRF